MEEPALVVFRRDLRIADNAALRAATAYGPTLALYVLDDAADGRPLGGAGRWWLHHAIVRLQGQLADLGVPLILRVVSFSSPSAPQQAAGEGAAAHVAGLRLVVQVVLGGRGRRSRFDR